MDPRPPVARHATPKAKSMQTLTLLHSETFPISRYADALSREAISSRKLESLDQLLVSDTGSLRVALIDPGIVNGRHAVIHLDPRTAVVGVGIEGNPNWLADDSVYLHLP